MIFPELSLEWNTEKDQFLNLNSPAFILMKLLLIGSATIKEVICAHKNPYILMSNNFFSVINIEYLERSITEVKVRSYERW